MTTWKKRLIYLIAFASVVFTVKMGYDQRMKEEARLAAIEERLDNMDADIDDLYEIGY